MILAGQYRSADHLNATSGAGQSSGNSGELYPIVQADPAVEEFARLLGQNTSATIGAHILDETATERTQRPINWLRSA